MALIRVLLAVLLASPAWSQTVVLPEAAPAVELQPLSVPSLSQQAPLQSPTAALALPSASDLLQLAPLTGSSGPGSGRAETRPLSIGSRPSAARAAAASATLGASASQAASHADGAQAHAAVPSLSIAERVASVARSLRLEGLGANEAGPEPRSYVQHMSELLDIEREAEIAEARRELEGPLPIREALGTSVGGMTLTETASAPGGLPILGFAKEAQGALSPFHALSPGDLVRLTGPNQTVFEGTVYYAHGARIGVAVERASALPQSNWRIDKIASDATYKRTKDALEKLKRTTDPDVLRLRDVFLGRRAPGLGPMPEIEVINPRLNDYQKDAVRMALAAKDAAVIHGPPGTGKTTTLVELILQAVQRGEKVLATAPSNVAVDNILEKLLESGVRVVRLGHPARTAEALRHATLDAQLAADPSAKELRRLEARRGHMRTQMEKERRRGKQGKKGSAAEEFAYLNKRARELEDDLKRKILEQADVVLATHAGVKDRLKSEPFDLVVMDEASQATEPLSWIPLLQARKAVFAGDPLQLPPTIQSTEAERLGLGRTLMDRLVALLPESLQALLRVQYRMHKDIMGFSSKEFYKDLLIAHPSVEGHTAKDLPGAAETDLTRVPVQFVDTAGSGFQEAHDRLTSSLENDGEARLTVRIIDELKAAGIPASDIGVITPYAAQVRKLKELTGEGGPEIHSVDGFQGREKEVIVLSLVRSNGTHDVGFLQDLRRLNVALTRARRSLIVIGDSSTLARQPLYSRFIAYVQANGTKRSAFEWPE